MTLATAMSTIPTTLRSAGGTAPRAASAAAVAGQVLNVYLRAVALEMKAKEQLEVIGRLEALEKAASEHRPGGRRWGA